MNRNVLLTMAVACGGVARAATCPGIPGKVCEWTVDKMRAASEGTTLLRNGTQVRVSIKGTNPFDVCEVKKDRSDITPDKDALSAFLDTIGKFGGALAFVGAGAANTPATDKLNSSTGKQFLVLLERANAEATRVNNALITFNSNASALRDAMAKFQAEQIALAAPPSKKQVAGAPPALSNAEKAEKFVEGRANLVKQIGSLQLARPTLDLFKKELADIEKLRGQSEYTNLTPDEQSQVNTYLGRLYDRQQQLTNLLSQADDTIKASTDYSKKLMDLDPIFDKTFPSFSDTDAKDKMTVTCKDGITSKPTLDTVTATFEFHNRPQFSLGVGLLISTLDSVQIGKKDVADGAGKSKTIFAEVDHKSVQVIPFSFLNWRLPKIGDFNVSRWTGGLHLTGGFGVNPNTGAKEPEFFSGGAFSIGSVVFYTGAHYGRIQSLGGAFTLGSTVPSGVTVPVDKRYKTGLAFGISYQIPLR